MFDISSFIPQHYRDEGVTDEFASACLKVRLETLNSMVFDDGYCPDYYEKAHAISIPCPRGVHPVVLGEYILDKIHASILKSL